MMDPGVELDTLNYKIREVISVFIPHIFESVFVEIINNT